MYAKIKGFTTVGIKGQAIDVEIDLSNSLPGFEIVGLPNTAVKEARERVRAAIKNSGFEFTRKRITVNLAPADVRKEGSMLDLPMAIGLLLLSGELRSDQIEGTGFLGELSLDGEIKGVNGVLPMVLEAEERGGYDRVIVPLGNFAESCQVRNVETIGVADLKALVELLREGEGRDHDRTRILIKKQDWKGPAVGKGAWEGADMEEVKGHWAAKRALEVAAAGNHNVLLAGPPGSGKTMLAKRIVSIMPELTYEERLEVTKILSVSGMLRRSDGIASSRPIRCPHHSISTIGLAGGGASPKPGEVSLAHRGVLFLDEIPEFDRNTLEVLRQPLEQENIVITRLQGAVEYPASFLLIGSMNHCSCGYYSDGTDRCKCTYQQIRNYNGRISGPLMDRIDIRMEVPSIKYEEIHKAGGEETSERIRTRVERAVAIQRERFRNEGITRNSQMGIKHLKKFCQLREEQSEVLRSAAEKLNLSTRGIMRILKVARTIADLGGAEEIGMNHLLEAISYRNAEMK